MFRMFGILGAATMMAGCATHHWTAGPEAATDFEVQKGRCSLMARSADRGVIAIGDPSFVGAASFGNAVGNLARRQQNFNDCMRATGWRMTD